MALVLADRVKETTTTTGTGTYTLAGAVTGFESFGSIGDTNTTYYCCTDGDDFEVGIGTYTSSGTTLARTTILESSNSDAAVNWTSGTRTIFCTIPAEKLVFEDASGNVTLPDNAEFRFGDNVSNGDLRIRHNGSNNQIQGYTGQLQITNFADNNDVRILTDNGSGGTADYFRADGSNGEAVLYHYGTEKFATKSGGVDVSGDITVSGDIVVSGGEISMGPTTDANRLRLIEDTQQTNEVLKIQNDVGYARIGPQNTGYNHFITDRSSNYFNTTIEIGNGQIRSYDGDFNLNRAGSTTARIRITDGTTHSDQALDVTGNITVSGTVDGRDLANDGTKLDGIEDSADVTDTANVTAAGALMDSEVTNLAQVKAFDSSDYATAAQGTTADAALPKAGGTMTGDLVFGDDIDAQFGASTDLVLKHNGTNSVINNNTGNLVISQFANDSDVVINSDDGSGGTANYFRADGSTGDAILYHYGTEKIKTQSGGATVTGTLTADGVSLGDNEKVQLGASNDLQMYHNTYGYIDNNTSHLYIRNNVDDDDGGNIYIQAKSGEHSIICNDDSTVALYYNNSLRMTVSSWVYFYSTLYANSYDLYINDVFFNGNIDGSDNDKILLGTGDDFQLYHDGTDNIIEPTNGQLVVAKTGTGSTELQIGGKATTGGSATLTLTPVNGYGSAIVNAAGSSSSLYLQQNGTTKATVSSSALTLDTGVDLIFEGATADANETTVTVADPTADRTITLPDATGTVVLNTNLNFPFFQADGTSDTIALTADSKIPFTEADGTANNIPLTT